MRERDVERARPGPHAQRAEPRPSPGGAVPDVNVLAERWDEIVSSVRLAGNALLATALETASPVAVNAQGAVLVEFDEPNDIYERAFESNREALVSSMRSLFPGVARAVLRRPERPAAAPSKERLTSEGVKAQRLAALRKKDPLLVAAIEALDLDLLD